MRIFWTIYRVLVIVFSVGVLFLTPLFMTGPNGTTVDPQGSLLDALAIAALTVSVGSLWTERRR